MELKVVCKPLFISKISTAYFNGLNSTVDAFSRSIAYLQDDRIGDSPTVDLMVFAATLMGSS